MNLPQEGRAFTDNAAAFLAITEACASLGIHILPANRVAALAAQPTLEPSELADQLLMAYGVSPSHERALRDSLRDRVAATLRYPCPCCGFDVHSEPVGSYAICPLCHWEDDALQLEFATTLGGGANTPTLHQAQTAYAGSWTDYPGLGRPSTRAGYKANPDWRLIAAGVDRFPQWGVPDTPRAPALDLRLYYWRSDYWLRAINAV